MYFPLGTSLNTPYFDYSADGVLRSIEDSLQRMRFDRLDIRVRPRSVAR